MKPILVHSTKYDGSLHYRYPTVLVQETPGLLMLYGVLGTPLESYRGDQIAPWHSLELYWADRFYNLSVTWRAHWQPHSHYINIATPATWSDGTLRYVDIDLDVIWRASTSEVVLDDQDEFAQHQLRFGYPSDLIDQAWRSSEEVRAMIAQRIYPFDGSLHSWRPDGSS